MKKEFRDCLFYIHYITGVTLADLSDYENKP